MDLKQIEKLMAAMGQAHIKRVVIKRQDFEIEIEKECMHAPSVSYSPAPVYAPLPMAHEHKTPINAAQSSAADETEKSNSLFVTSPMVGTFYASPAPDDPHFVKVGDTISENSVVCIIEAMKVMNEVKAGVKGTIAEILVRNGEPVEFGTRIFRVNPA